MAKRTGPVAHMKEPFDDAVFRALAALHGLERDAMPVDVAVKGWNVRKGRAVCAGSGDIPEGMPDFSFIPASGPGGSSMVIEMGGGPDDTSIRYGRLPRMAWVHIDARTMPTTIATMLPGRAITDVVIVPGLEDWLIEGVSESGGTLSISVAPARKGKTT